MIIADLSIWASVLRGYNPGLSALVKDLLQQEILNTPPIVFAQLLREDPEPRHSQQIRGWVELLPPLPLGPQAWIAAGGLGALLGGEGLNLKMVDLFLLAVAIREEAQFWSMNPLSEQLIKHLPLKLYQPKGL